MNYTKKRALAAVLSVFMISALFSGCNSSKGNSSNSAGSGAGAGGKKIITVMASGVKVTGGNDFTCDILPKEVNKLYPNITIEATKLPDDQYYTALKTKLASGDAPDIIWVQPREAGANGVMSLAKAGYLADLSDLKFWNNVQGTGEKDMSYNGKPYAVTSGVAMLGVWYNKNIFKQNNLSVPQNWTEFLSVCKTLKSKGTTPIVMGDKDAYMMQFGIYQIAANQVYPQNANFDTDLATGKTKFTDPIWIKTLTMYKSLYDNGYIVKSSLGLGQAQSQQQFNDGEAAMTFDGTFSEEALESKGKVDFERGFFPLPGNDASGKTYVAGATGAGFAIYVNSKYVQDIKNIFNVMCDGKSDLFKAWSTKQSYISTYKGVALQDSVFADALNLYNQGRTWYWCNQMWPAGTENEMEAKFGEIIGNQGTTVQQVAQAMQLKYEELSKGNS